jgi:hypothetical protein
LLDNAFAGVYPVHSTWLSATGKIEGVFILRDLIPGINLVPTQPVEPGSALRKTVETISGLLEFIDGVPPSDAEIREWFDKIGKNEIPVYSENENDFSLDTLENADLLFNNIVSHFNFYKTV